MFALKRVVLLAANTTATRIFNINRLPNGTTNIPNIIIRSTSGQDCGEKYKLTSKTALGEACICWDNIIATLDDIPKTRECWYVVYNRNNKTYDLILGVGGALFAAGLAVFAMTVNMLFNPASSVKLDPNDFDQDEKECVACD